MEMAETSKNSLEYKFEHIDSYDGQNNWELGLYIPKGIIGMIQYTTFEGEITISDILVRPEFRRKGVGSRMVKAIKNKHPKYTYKPSMKTDLGVKFKHKDVGDMNVMGEGLIDEHFDTTIDDDIKEHSNRYIGRGVTWYGSPDQMISVNKNYIDFTPENMFDDEKIEFLRDLIINHDENVEIECSYGSANIIKFQDILEEQQSVFLGEFEQNYNGTVSPSSIGDDELDNYIGSEELEESELMGYESYDDPDLYEMLNKNRFYLVNGKSNDYIKEIVNDLSIENEDMIGEPLTSRDYEYVKIFMDIENKIFESIKDGWGDIGTMRITLGDGNHRVSAAIEAGEEFICLNLVEDDIIKYSNEIKELKYINRIS